MRIRSIKPEFWSSEDTARLTWDERLLFIGIWSYVDDNSVGRDNDKLIVAALFPLEDDPRETLAKVSRGLQSLENKGFITRYIAEGRRYLCVNKWEHQKIDRPSKPRYPLPENALTSDDSNTRDTLASVVDMPRDTLAAGSGNRGTEEQVTEEQGVGTRAERATRLPDGWMPDQANIDKTKADCPLVDLRRAHEMFTNHFQAKSGRDATKRDWNRTWRNWMLTDQRRAEERAPRTNLPATTNQPGIGKPSLKAMGIYAAGEQLIAEIEGRTA